MDDCEQMFTDVHRSWSKYLSPVPYLLHLLYKNAAWINTDVHNNPHKASIEQC